MTTNLESNTIDQGENFIARVKRCAAAVLGQTEVGRQVQRLCDQQIDARNLLSSDRGDGRGVVAVVGPTGQGKSWLIRQMIQSADARNQIRSGNNIDEATEKLVWVGPTSPVDLDGRYEDYVSCIDPQMASLGFPYLLLDAPGATDDRGAVAAVARRALSLSSVLILVARRDQLRAEAVGMLAAATEGSVVVPVINMVRGTDDEQQTDHLRADIEAFVARIRQIAPESRIAAAVIVEDFEVSQRDESAVGREAVDAISHRVAEQTDGGLDVQRRRRVRLEAMDTRFRQSLQQTLAGHLPNLTSAVRKINDEAGGLPASVAEGLVGGGASLAAAIRGRLRLSLLSDTPGFWFPYRSQLGFLNLTHGAWDRLFLSLSGSLPSLVSAVYTSGRNLIGDRDAVESIREGLKQRGDAAVSARLGPLTRQFRREIGRLRGENQTSPSNHTGDDAAASLTGLDALQERSQTIFNAAIEQHAAPWWLAWIIGAVGTIVFWGLMSGPILTIYRAYFAACYGALQTLFIGQSEATGSWDRLAAFPRPDLGLWITSILLSILPVALLAMLALSWVQRRRRVKRAGEQIQQQHHDAIAEMQRDGTLRLVWDDPLLGDAEFLLSVGQNESSSGDP